MVWDRLDSESKAFQFVQSKFKWNQLPVDFRCFTCSVSKSFIEHFTLKPSSRALRHLTCRESSGRYVLKHSWGHECEASLSEMSPAGCSYVWVEQGCCMWYLVFILLACCSQWSFMRRAGSQLSKNRTSKAEGGQRHKLNLSLVLVLALSEQFPATGSSIA